MFRHLDHSPSFLERLGLHFAVVTTLAGFIGGALTLHGAGAVVASTAHGSRTHDLALVTDHAPSEPHLAITVSHHR
jgi:hypothetical protein